jgi:hypothetical protein
MYGDLGYTNRPYYYQCATELLFYFYCHFTYIRSFSDYFQIKLQHFQGVFSSRDFSQQNLIKFKNSLSSLGWETILEEDDPQLSFNNFSDVFHNLYNLYCPIKEIKFNKNFHAKEPWMTRGLLISRSRKLQLASL